MSNDQNSNQPEPQEPPDLEAYRIPGTNMINFSRYVRENTIYPEPQFKVGDVVVFTVITEITAIGKDCDGSTLYTADMIGGGWGEESFRAATEEEQKSY